MSVDPPYDMQHDDIAVFHKLRNKRFALFPEFQSSFAVEGVGDQVVHSDFLFADSAVFDKFV